MIKFCYIIFFLLTFQQDTIIGEWITYSDDLIIECYKKENMYYGKIKWFKDSNPKIKQYSNRGLPKSKWIGAVVMKDFKYNGDVLEGVIYDVKYGNTWNAIIINENNTIIVTPYIFSPILGKSIIFYKKSF